MAGHERPSEDSRANESEGPLRVPKKVNPPKTAVDLPSDFLPYLASLT